MKKGLLFLIAIAMVAVLVACGGGEEATGGGDGSSVDIKASNFEFDKSEYTVPAGDVTVSLESTDGYHGITIDGTDVKIDGEGSQSVSLEAGEYTIVCSIPCGEGHDDMTATLIVE